jgi:MFS transporter, AAHS family, 4-hydroxybenzoate transporter
MTNLQGGADPPTIDIVDFIDRQPVRGFQIGVLMTCAAVLFLDGFDTQAIGFVAPALAREWGLGKGALGPVFSAGLFGLMLGALAFGPLADRVGRKKVIIFSTLAFGLGAVATAFVHDVGELLAIRFLTGLGLGGAMPNAIATTSEFSPRRRRATMVMIMFCGFTVGAALSGPFTADMIPRFGWRSVFAVGGLVPLAMVPLLALRLPESVRFLALRGDASDRVAALLARISSHTVFAPDVRFVVHESRLDGIPVAHLFREGRTPVTLLLWAVFFMSLLDIYFLSYWLPTVLNDLGASVSEAAIIGSLLQVGGVVGTFTLGVVVDRFSFRALGLTYFCGVFAVAAIGQVGHSAPLVAVAILAAGFCIIGGQIAANGLTAGYYPTAVRATGVGWALGVGRIGSIVGPLVAGVLLTEKWSVASVFLTAAAAALCATLACFALGQFTNSIAQPTSLDAKLRTVAKAEM